MAIFDDYYLAGSLSVMNLLPCGEAAFHTLFRLARVTRSGETHTDKTTTSLAVDLLPQGS
jgi:hypothetical protein